MPWKSKGPLSLSGATAAPVACLSPSLRFRVVPPVDAALPNGAAGVALDEPLLADWDWASGAPLLELSGGAPCFGFSPLCSSLMFISRTPRRRRRVLARPAVCGRAEWVHRARRTSEV